MNVGTFVNINTLMITSLDSEKTRAESKRLNDVYTTVKSKTVLELSDLQ